MDEADILLAATQMVRLHGAGAVAAAAERVNRMQAQGDREGFHAWTRIKDAIADMDRKKDGAV